MKRVRIFSIAVISLGLCPYAKGDVYKFVGQGGEVFYTQKINPIPLRSSGSYSSGRSSSGQSRSVQILRRDYADLILRIAQNQGLDPDLLHAVIQAESAYDPFAVSTKGAVGLMQLMPDTAARFGIWDPYDPEQNILGGARYLRQLLVLFGLDVQLAIAAYNAGENNVLRHGKKIPPFEETKNYVNKVMGYYNEN